MHYWADDETLYRTLLWSRLSSHILLPIVQAKVFSDLDLYSAVVGVNWLDYFDEKVHFFVDFNGTNQEIRHTQFGAMRVKDGIVDYFERHGRWRINSAPLITSADTPAPATTASRRLRRMPELRFARTRVESIFTGIRNKKHLEKIALFFLTGMQNLV